MRLERLTSTRVDDHIEVRAELVVNGHGRTDVRMRPGIGAYGPAAPPLAEVALHSTPRQDLQIAVRRIDPTANRADLDVFVKPFVSWVWSGALLMLLGGAWSLVRRPAPNTEDALSDDRSGAFAASPAAR